MSSKSSIHPPLVGEIITIGRSQKQLLVVFSQSVIDRDHTRGESYSVHQLKCVQIAADRWDRPQQAMCYPGAKLMEFYLEGGSMRGKGKEIKLADITVIGLSRVSTEVVTTYHMDKPAYISGR